MTLVKVNHPMHKAFDGLMKEFFTDFPATLGKSVREDFLQFPPVNITEKSQSYLIEMAAPGFEKTDFQIKVDDKLLNISAEQKTEKTETEGKMIRQEYSQKSFKRSFTLDEKIQADAITARYENGVLFLELPKRVDANNGTKEISVL